jgi:hypothetical protein
MLQRPDYQDHFILRNLSVHADIVAFTATTAKAVSTPLPVPESPVVRAAGPCPSVREPHRTRNERVLSKENYDQNRGSYLIILT